MALKRNSKNAIKRKFNCQIQTKIPSKAEYLIKLYFATLLDATIAVTNRYEQTIW